MIWLLLATTVWLVSLYGIGWPAATARRRAGIAQDPAGLALDGFAALVLLWTVAILLNFLVPLRPAIGGTLLALGWLLAAARLRTRSRALVARTDGGAAAGAGRRSPARRGGLGWPAIIGAALAAVAAAAVGSVPNAWYDAGLYYEQTLAWLQQGAVPTGLANLHGRLAFNSAWHALAAVLQTPWIVNGGLGLTNVLAFSLYGSAIAGCLWGWRSRGEMDVPSAFLAASAIPWLTHLRATSLTSGSPDAPVVFLGLLAGYATLRAVEVPSVATPLPRTGALATLHRGPQAAVWLCVAGALALVAIPVKLSAAPLLLLPLCGLVRLLVRPSEEGRRESWNQAWHFATRSRRRWVILGLVALGVVLPWMARGMLLSGCPAYPASVGCLFELPWSAPPAQLEAERQGILEFGQRSGGFTGDVLVGWGWLPGWTATFLANARTRVAVLLAALGVGGWLLGRAPPLGPRVQASVLVLEAAALGGLGVWFVNGPNVRFGEVYLWLAALPVAAIGLQAITSARSRVRGSWLAAAPTFALSVAILGATGLTLRAAVGPAGIARLIEWPGPQRVDVQPRTTRDGATVFVPATGDQCWDAPLPCTPYFDERLLVQRPEGSTVPTGFVAGSRR